MSELANLAGLLHQAATYARVKIDAIPADASLEEECAIIEAVIIPAEAIAELIVTLPAQGRHDFEAKARAQSWLDGRYWTGLAPAA